MFLEQAGGRQRLQRGDHLGQRGAADADHLHRTRHRQAVDLFQGLAIELDEQHLVQVIDLREGQRQWRAAIADARLPGDLLRLVQVAEGDVGDGLGKQAGRQGLGIADDDIALGLLRDRAAGHVRMAHGNQRLAGLAHGLGGGDEAFMHLSNAGHVVVAQRHSGDLGRAQEGQGEAPGGGVASGVVQRHQQPLVVQLALGDPADAADGMGIEALHQRRRQLDAPARVVVAGDHHDVQLRELFVGADDEVVEALLGLEWRVDRVEHVAGDQQGVGAVGYQLVEQPGEELRVFVVAVLAVEGLAEVPVGGVDQAHGLRLIVCGRRGEPLAWFVRREVASDVRLVGAVGCGCHLSCCSDALVSPCWATHFFQSRKK